MNFGFVEFGPFSNGVFLKKNEKFERFQKSEFQIQEDKEYYFKNNGSKNYIFPIFFSARFFISLIRRAA